jgi:hypothetical protein
MQVKILEVRDDGTFIPVVAVLMMPHESGDSSTEDQFSRQRYLLRRAGYATDNPTRQPLVVIFNANGGRPANYDPYSWTNRTMATAHLYITENFSNLKDGDVVDVEFIRGEKPTAKVSERITVED